jgi:ABC-type multidrug transport system ATPase subunit
MPSIEINFREVEITLSSGYFFTVSGKLSFDSGDCILVLGENSAGKTTILSLIQSLYEAEERGSILKASSRSRVGDYYSSSRLI